MRTFADFFWEFFSERAGWRKRHIQVIKEYFRGAYGPQSDFFLKCLFFVCLKAVFSAKKEAIPSQSHKIALFCDFSRKEGSRMSSKLLLIGRPA